jgi:bifunctional DNA-binding transcriptional regulator/antitoxin component of YhaV-PrlF toxin-antitoxin module
MKDTARIQDDGQLTIDAEILRRAGFQPGDRVEFTEAMDSLVVVRERDADKTFKKWAGLDRTRPPMSVEEIVAEIREMRGHDDLD